LRGSGSVVGMLGFLLFTGPARRRERPFVGFLAGVYGLVEADVHPKPQAGCD
jgi:hypothetical protein